MPLVKYIDCFYHYRRKVIELNDEIEETELNISHSLQEVSETYTNNVNNLRSLSKRFSRRFIWNLILFDIFKVRELLPVPTDLDEDGGSEFNFSIVPVIMADNYGMS